MKSLKKIRLFPTKFLILWGPRFLLLFFICSCATQTTTYKVINSDLSKEELLKKIYEINKEYCNYERKAHFKIIDDYLNEEFKGFIKNSCDNKLSLNILGPFSKRLLSIRVEDGKIYVDGRDNLDKSIKTLLEDKDINKLVKIFKFPYMFPDDQFSFHKMSNFYLLSLDNIRIYVNDQLFIYMVEVEDGYIKYEFKKNAVSSIYYRDKDTYLKIDFS